MQEWALSLLLPAMVRHAAAVLPDEQAIADVIAFIRSQSE